MKTLLIIQVVKMIRVCFFLIVTTIYAAQNINTLNITTSVDCVFYGKCDSDTSYENVYNLILENISCKKNYSYSPKCATYFMFDSNTIKILNIEQLQKIRNNVSFENYKNKKIEIQKILSLRKDWLIIEIPMFEMSSLALSSLCEVPVSIFQHKYKFSQAFLFSLIPTTAYGIVRVSTWDNDASIVKATIYF